MAEPVSTLPALLDEFLRAPNVAAHKKRQTRRALEFTPSSRESLLEDEANTL